MRPWDRLFELLWAKLGSVAGVQSKTKVKKGGGDHGGIDYGGGDK
jgi:hypothetical protein